MVAFSELFAVVWQEYWLEFHQGNYIPYYEDLLFAHFQKNEVEKLRVRKRGKESYLDVLREEGGLLF